MLIKKENHLDIIPITYDEFARVELRCGTIIKIEPFPKARKPAYKVWVDFGEQFGIKQTSAQITQHYTPDSLLNRRVIGCLNLGTKNIGGFVSEFLLVGFPDQNQHVCLASVDREVPNGAKLF
jgi:tRNA-binding protein